MILRRADEGALKCALRDLRLDDETVALYFIVPVTLTKEGDLFATSVALFNRSSPLFSVWGRRGINKIERSMTRKTDL